MSYQDDTLNAIRTQDPKSLVYIAAPYTARWPDGTYNIDKMEERIKLMAKCMAKLMADYNVMPTSPLLMHLVRMHTNDLPGDWSTWEDYSKIVMDTCDYMIVLDMDGMSTSTGVTAERDYMQNAGKLIFFVKADELLNPPVKVTPPPAPEPLPRPENGDNVIAIRDGHGFKKGDKGKLNKQGAIDSENYYLITLESGENVGPSLEDYWEKDVSTAETKPTLGCLPKVMGIQVVPVIDDGKDVTAQFDGPTDATTGWAVYNRLPDGTAKWVSDHPDETQAMQEGLRRANHYGVEIEPQAWVKGGNDGR